MLAHVLLFLMIAASQWADGPVYFGYAAAYLGFAGLGFVNAPNRSFERSRLEVLSIPHLLLVGVGVSALWIAWVNSSHLRDVFRDIGSVVSFFVGRYLLVRSISVGTELKLIRLLSTLGVWLAFVTLAASILAYLSGASAYEWRGDFVPQAASWLPYCLVCSLALSGIEREHAAVQERRALLCVLAILASLSRTDAVLLTILMFTLALLPTKRIFQSSRVRWSALACFLVVAAAFPFFLQLDVVQERIAFMVGDRDMVTDWRMFERICFDSMVAGANALEHLLGFGFGARMPLLYGMTDFDRHESIPVLHNSYLTIYLKFGIIGILVLAIFIFVEFLKVLRRRKTVGGFSPFDFAGLWIVIFCMLKGITLQGLTEWSHLVFFGIGFRLLNGARSSQSRSPFTTNG